MHSVYGRLDDMTDKSMKKYILYADDDPDDQRDMMELIEEINQDVILLTFKNGLELAGYTFDVMPCNNPATGIIIDMHMPVWDGLQTLKALRVKPAVHSIPVLMISAGITDLQKNQALQLGATACAEKPVHPGEWATFKSILSRCFVRINEQIS
jgi:CheY-like chemotaxis protein